MRKRINKILKCNQALKIHISISLFVVMTLKKKHTSMRSWEGRNSELNYGIEDPEIAVR